MNVRVGQDHAEKASLDLTTGRNIQSGQGQCTVLPAVSGRSFMLHGRANMMRDDKHGEFSAPILTLGGIAALLMRAYCAAGLNPVFSNNFQFVRWLKPGLLGFILLLLVPSEPATISHVPAFATGAFSQLHLVGDL